MATEGNGDPPVLDLQTIDVGFKQCINLISHVDLTLLNDFEMATEGNGDPPVLDLRTIDVGFKQCINLMVIDGVVQPVAPTTAEQRLARKNELKAREWRTHTLIWRNKTDLEDQISTVACVSAAITKVYVSALPNVDTLSDAFIYSIFARDGPSMADGYAEYKSKEFPLEDWKESRSPVYDRYKSREGYHTVPPPYTGTFMPPKPKLVFHDAPTINETVHIAFNVEPSTTKPTLDLSQSNRPSAPIIEDWVSDLKDDSKGEPMPTQKASSFVQTTKHVKTPKPSVKPVEHPIPAENLKNYRNRKACFVYKSLTYLIKGGDYYEKKTVQQAIRHHAMRGNHQHYAKITHPNPQRHVVPTSVLTRSRLVLLPAARPVNTAIPYTKGDRQHALKDKGVIDSGCSRHMIGNISYLFDFEEINGGYVAFGGNPKGGKITGKGKIRTDNKCIVLSSDFKLRDENHVLPRVPRENNMYNVDLKNVVPSGDLTCLFANATLDESNIWHRRLGHINFKNMNKLVKVKEPEFEIKEPKSEVHVSLSSSTKTKKHDDKTKREAKDMPALEDITYSDNEEDVGVEADFSNLETNITEELLQFKMQKVWVLVDMPKGKRAIGSKWVFRNKKDERGIVIRNKAQLVAQGHTQKEGIYYEEVFALVVRIKAIRLFLAYASFIRFMVYQMDVKSAFLYGTIEEEVYVCQPLGFENPDYPDKVYKVVKALYGLHQAPRGWYETLANYLLENGFHRGQIDQTLFIKKQKSNILLVQVYVNDIIFGSTNKDLCKAFEKLMKDKFQMSSMGELSFFLGLCLQVKQKQDGIFTSQDKYVAEILRKFDLTDEKSASIPVDIEKPLLKDLDDEKSASIPVDIEKPLLKDLDGEDVDVHIYRSMIGSLMYQTSSRPDIMCIVCTCAHF
nr:putative ribonuclease H-like domain-containing protein [Tanacetum cinerariifolium]